MESPAVPISVGPGPEAEQEQQEQKQLPSETRKGIANAGRARAFNPNDPQDVGEGTGNLANLHQAMRKSGLPKSPRTSTGTDSRAGLPRSNSTLHSKHTIIRSYSLVKRTGPHAAISSSSPPYAGSGLDVDPIGEAPKIGKQRGAVSPDWQNYKFSKSPDAPTGAAAPVSTAQPKYGLRSRLSRSLSLHESLLHPSPAAAATAAAPKPDSCAPVIHAATPVAPAKNKPVKALARSLSLGAPLSRSAIPKAINPEKKYLTRTFSRLGSIKNPKSGNSLKRSPAATTPKFGEWNEKDLKFGYEITVMFDSVRNEKKGAAGGGLVRWAELQRSNSNSSNSDDEGRKKGPAPSLYRKTSNLSSKSWQDANDAELHSKQSGLLTALNWKLEPRRSFNQENGRDHFVNKQQPPRTSKVQLLNQKSFVKTHPTEAYAAPTLSASKDPESKWEGYAAPRLSASKDSESKWEAPIKSSPQKAEAQIKSSRHKAEENAKEANMVPPNVSKWLCCAATAVKA